jgi:hypothetical protein
MKRYLLFLFAGLLAACASNVLVYDPVSQPVPGRSQAYLLSVHTPEWQGRSNALVNPALPNHPLEWTRVSNGVVVAMSVVESNSIVSAEASSRAAAIAFSEAQAKTNAITTISRYTAEGRLVRALAEATMDEINILRTNLSLTPRTLTQLTNAIRNKLQAQPDSTP